MSFNSALSLSILGCPIATSIVTPTDPVLTGTSLLLEAKNVSSSEGTTIQTWNDSSGNARNASQADSSKRAIYRTSFTINGKPTIQFDGTDDFYSVDLSFLNGGFAYTFFVVEARNTSSGYARYFVGNESSNSNEGLHLGYRGNTEITSAQYFNDLNGTISGYSGTPTAKLWVFTKGAAGTFIYDKTTLIASNGNTQGLTTANNGRIGRGFGTGDHYSGYITCVAVLNSQLTLTQITDQITNYFTPVYGI